MVYFLVPIYNEELNIPALRNSFAGLLADKANFFVFSDDGSSDSSVKMLNEYFSGVAFTVIENKINKGPGNAFNEGFEWILSHSNNENDTVITLEADGTSDLGILPAMLGINRLGYDLVLASVYAQGGGFDKTSFFRRMISSAGNIVFRFFFDLKILTLSSFYRVYSLSLLRKIKQKYPVLITETGFTCMLEILIKSLSVGCQVIEVPMMLYSAKRKGKSKMKILKTTFSYLRVIAKFRFSGKN